MRSDGWCPENVFLFAYLCVYLWMSIYLHVRVHVFVFFRVEWLALPRIGCSRFARSDRELFGWSFRRHQLVCDPCETCDDHAQRHAARSSYPRWTELSWFSLFSPPLPLSPSSFSLSLSVHHYGRKKKKKKKKNIFWEDGDCSGGCVCGSWSSLILSLFLFAFLHVLLVISHSFLSSLSIPLSLPPSFSLSVYITHTHIYIGLFFFSDSQSLIATCARKDRLSVPLSFFDVCICFLFLILSVSLHGKELIFCIHRYLSLYVCCSWLSEWWKVRFFCLERKTCDVRRVFLDRFDECM